MQTAKIIPLSNESNRMSNVKQGHIVLHRSVNNADWANEAMPFALWAKLLCMASHKDRAHTFDGKNWNLKTGQLVSTYAILGKMIKINGVDTDKVIVRKIINMFCEQGRLSKERQGNSIVITITNYAQYQSDFFDTLKVTPSDTPLVTLKDNNDKDCEVVSDTLKVTPSDTPLDTQNNTLLNNTLNNKTYTSSDDDNQVVKKGNKNKHDYQGIMDAYCDVVLDGLPIPDELNAKRKTLINKLAPKLKNSDVSTFKAYFGRFMSMIEDKPFYFGIEAGKKWRATFDYVLRVETLTKVKEDSL